MKKPLREVDIEWENFPDFKYRRKEISSWLVEGIYGEERGGKIIIYTKTKMGNPDTVGDLAWEIKHQDNLGYFNEIYNVISYKGKYYRLVDEINFMQHENVKYEYNQLDSVDDIMKLLLMNI